MVLKNVYTKSVNQLEKSWFLNHMNIISSLKVFEMAGIEGSLIPNFSSKNWNRRFFDPSIFKEPESMVL